jgi:hypothetical protein
LGTQPFGSGTSGMSLCLLAGAASATLALEAFTLAWAHSIEKIRWEEDWQVEGQTLAITEARIRGSGAGMEPPPEATLRNGVWHYRPALPAQSSLRLTHSQYVAGYEICSEGRCTTLADSLPGIENNALIELRPCQP